MPRLELRAEAKPFQPYSDTVPAPPGYYQRVAKQANKHSHILALLDARDIFCNALDELAGCTHDGFNTAWRAMKHIDKQISAEVSRG